jgi:hypothetical protein
MGVNRSTLYRALKGRSLTSIFRQNIATAKGSNADKLPFLIQIAIEITT